MNNQYDPDTYYSRQTVLREIGRAGQQKLHDSHVAVIGLGGLGSVSSLYLTLAGVGQLTLVDQDTVELNNLHRQALFSFKDIRHPKVEVAADRLATLNPEVKIEAIADNVNAENVTSILGSSDCIVDGLDNMYTRYLLNRHCVERQIPYIFGGAIGLEGNVAVFKTPETPCLECIMPSIDDSNLPTCDTRGVIGATPGIIGSLQALETIKILVGVNQKIASKLMVFDFAESEFRTIELHIRPDCPVCQQPKRPVSGEKRIVMLCGSSTVNVNPEHPTALNMDVAKRLLQDRHRILLTTPMVLVVDYKGHEVSIFRRGRMLIKNVQSDIDALQLYDEITRIIRN